MAAWTGDPFSLWPYYKKRLTAPCFAGTGLKYQDQFVPCPGLAAPLATGRCGGIGGLSVSTRKFAQTGWQGRVSRFILHQLSEGYVVDPL
ncbi:MAG: hypothetical protein DI616_04215 [Paracoccus denitrificans]|uniref:Uncharacterized protein n=1 Tax=Paracoccus denitrificans TaxID=266 RepID=A0A533IA18_PARDE|nr:MAG: hypothetical protein DI616_04215 [Paracoccus denitrificans]